MQAVENYPDCLRDESRRTGHAETICFPRDEADLVQQVRAAAAAGMPLTTQGGRTGITGGAVPEGGCVLSCERMNRFIGLREQPGRGYLLTVQPGVKLVDLRMAVAACEFNPTGWSEDSCRALAHLQADVPHFFSPDPTETTASLGGMAACNASGARTLRFGSCRDSIHAARIVLADGDCLSLIRGEQQAAGRQFSLTTDTGRVLSGTLPSYGMPAVKNAAGYYVRDNMDLLDLWIGAEGTLGIFSELELLLIPAPPAMWGVMVFLDDEEQALRFVEQVRAAAFPPSALEYFDACSLDLLRRRKAAGDAVAADLAEIPPAWRVAVYVEYDGEEDAMESAMETMTEQLAACGGDTDATWLASDAVELETLKRFRHAVPEVVNVTIDERRKTDPELTKLGTDLAVPDRHLRDVMAMYHRDLNAAGLEYVLFGHIGNNHVHVNILPRSMADYEAGKALYLQWAQQVIAMGGTVSAEHGIGKLKHAMLAQMYGADGIEQMRTLRRRFDPAGRLNRGNLFV